MILRLENTTTHQEYQYDVVDVNNGEKLYFRFNINTLDLDDGEYTIKVYDGDELILTDILKIGDFNANSLQYKKNDNTYIEVELTAKIQEKEVDITDIATLVKPDSGFDGMSSVFVDAQPLYDAAYTEGYDEGREDGEAVSFDLGFEAGVKMQKAKLESISITENGTYTKEDGYNNVVVNVPDLNGAYSDGYDDGIVDGKEIGYNQGYAAGIDYASENAGEIAAANAIDLVATEFGTYYTKYSDNIVNPNPVTGIYPDGETFHNLANVKNNVYNTGIIPNETTKLEFWFKPDEVKDNQDGDWFSYVIASQVTDSYVFRIRHYHPGTSLQYEFQINNHIIRAYLETDVNHIEMSYADGLIVNGIKVDDFNQNIRNDFKTPLYINGDPALHKPPTRTDDGEFGMIKITQDGITNVIIPTEDGFKNITTNQILESVDGGGTYRYIKNDPIVLDSLIKSVDVQPKIDVEKYGIKFGRSTFKEIPDFYDFSNVTNYSSMFDECRSLQTIPNLDTSNVRNMSAMFNNCQSLTSIPQLDTSKVTDMSTMFSGCKSLVTIPQLDTSNVTNVSNMFNGCSLLTSIPALNAIKFNVPSYSGLFGYNDLNYLTDMGGFINLKTSLTSSYNLVRTPNLTYQSCINILNGLYDFTGNGETPTSSQGQLKVHSNFLTTVGDEISIGTLKGWLISN